MDFNLPVLVLYYILNTSFLLINNSYFRLILIAILSLLIIFAKKQKLNNIIKLIIIIVLQLYEDDYGSLCLLIYFNLNARYESLNKEKNDRTIKTNIFLIIMSILNFSLKFEYFDTKYFYLIYFISTLLIYGTLYINLNNVIEYFTRIDINYESLYMIIFGVSYKLFKVYPYYNLHIVCIIFILQYLKHLKINENNNELGFIGISISLLSLIILMVLIHYEIRLVPLILYILLYIFNYILSFKQLYHFLGNILFTVIVFNKIGDVGDIYKSLSEFIIMIIFIEYFFNFILNISND